MHQRSGVAQAVRVVEIIRPRLFAALQDAVDRGIRLIVVGASPGYGKTTLLKSFASNSERRLYLRVERGASAEELVRLLAAEVNAPIAEDEPLAGASTRYLASILRDRLREVAVLVLDDVHEGDPALRNLVALLAEFGQTVVAAIAGDLALPMATATAQGWGVNAVDERALTFATDEILELAAESGLELDFVAARRVSEATHGLPVAVRFALTYYDDLPSMTQLPDRSIALLRGYVAEQVMSNTTSEQREVLSWAAYLDRLDGPMLESLGIDHASRTLDVLASTGMHVDREARSYVVHPLVRDFVQNAESNESEAYRCRRWAMVGRRLAQAGDTAGAIRALLKARDLPELAALLRDHGESLLDRGEPSVRKAVALTRERYQNESWHSVIAGRLAIDDDDVVVAEACFRVAMGGKPAIRARAIQFLANLYCNRLQPEKAAEMLESLREPRDVEVRLLVESSLMVAHAQSGRSEAARRRRAELTQAVRTIDNLESRLRILQRCALAAAFTGDLDEADDRVREVIELSKAAHLARFEADASTVDGYLAALRGDLTRELAAAQAAARLGRAIVHRRAETYGLARLLVDHAESTSWTDFEFTSDRIDQVDPAPLSPACHGIVYARMLRDILHNRIDDAKRAFERHRSHHPRDDVDTNMLDAMLLAVTANAGSDASRRRVKAARERLNTLARADMNAMGSRSFAYAAFFVGVAEKRIGQNREAQRLAGTLRRVAKTPRDLTLSQATDLLTQGDEQSAELCASFLGKMGIPGLAMLVRHAFQ